MYRYIKSATNKSYICPKCGNNTMYDIDNGDDMYSLVGYHDRFICEECGAELYGSPRYDGTISYSEISDEEDW